MFLNITAYKFIAIAADELPLLCQNIWTVSAKLALKGTVILGQEGINLFLAGEEVSVRQFQSFLATIDYFSDLFYKNSYSKFIPFKKLIVAIRQEIVTFNQGGIPPEKSTAPYLTPQTLKEKLDMGVDITLLDTRNYFEYEIGAFAKAVHLNIENFREFPTALQQSFATEKSQCIVTYCTGGIRCEKAAAYLLENGYKEVYQLQGGIIHYFAVCGGEHFRGDCFVFDDRIAVNSKLEPIHSDSQQSDW